MKNKILSICFTLLAAIGFSQTIIPGGVVSGNWTQAGSPYHIQGAIMIANGTTLSIDAGVQVKFQGSYKLLVLGQLLAIGTSVDSITFTASDTTIGWLGIRFDGTSVTNDSSKFIYCKFEYGKATGAWPSTDNRGGAFYFNYYSKVIISNSKIINCTAYSTGGGISCYNSSPIITDNIIINNTSSIVGIGGSGGGGIFSFNGSPVISNNIIAYNSAIFNNQSNSSGGGINCDNSSFVINNTITNNYCPIFGGGVFCGIGSPTISNNTISNNVAGVGGGIGCYQCDAGIYDNVIHGNSSQNGGGIDCEDSNANISGNIISSNNASAFGGGINNMNNSRGNVSDNFITNNRATIDGGGVSFYNESTSEIFNNVIANNTALENGGGVLFRNSSNNVFYNNTISNNTAVTGGALACMYSSSPILRNTVIWGNTATTSGNQVFLFDDTSDPDFYYCDVQNGSTGFGLNNNVFYLGTYLSNLDTNALFISPASGSGIAFNGLTANWSLQGISSCINSGDLSGTYPLTDIEGSPRIIGNRIDMGAYEYQGITGTIISNFEDKISIYPNPTTENFTVSVNARMSTCDLQLEIFNDLGTSVYNQVFNKMSLTINAKQFPSGIYFVKVFGGDKGYCKKLIVE